METFFVFIYKNYVDRYRKVMLKKSLIGDKFEKTREIKKSCNNF